MKPSDKSPEMERVINDISGDNRRQAITDNRCVKPDIGCGKPVLDLVDALRVEEGAFRDERSRKEFTISGLCQRCQDVAFTAPDEGENEEDDDDFPY